MPAQFPRHFSCSNACEAMRINNTSIHSTRHAVLVDCGQSRCGSSCTTDSRQETGESAMQSQQEQASPYMLRAHPDHRRRLSSPRSFSPRTYPPARSSTSPSLATSPRKPSRRTASPPCKKRSTPPSANDPRSRPCCDVATSRRPRSCSNGTQSNSRRPSCAP